MRAAAGPWPRLQRHCAHWRVLRRHALGWQRSLPVPLRLFHPNAQGGLLASGRLSTLPAQLAPDAGLRLASALYQRASTVPLPAVLDTARRRSCPWPCSRWACCLAPTSTTPRPLPTWCWSPSAWRSRRMVRPRGRGGRPPAGGLRCACRLRPTGAPLWIAPAAAGPLHSCTHFTPACNWSELRALHPPPAGELNFNIVGVAFQLTSIFSESIRLVLVQILLQVEQGEGPDSAGLAGVGVAQGAEPGAVAAVCILRRLACSPRRLPWLSAPQSRGLKLNPVTTLYFVAPCCFCFLLVSGDRGPWLECAAPQAQPVAARAAFTAGIGRCLAPAAAPSLRGRCAVRRDPRWALSPPRPPTHPPRAVPLLLPGGWQDRGRHAAEHQPARIPVQRAGGLW